MPLNTHKYLSIFVGILLVGCSTLKPTKRITKTDGSPYQQIKDFSRDTEELKLDNAISQQRILSKNENFLRPVVNKKVKSWIKYFTTRNRAGLQRFIKNGERYRPLVEKIFSKYGLPKDLYYVGIIESGYQSRARSQKAAVGPWQFIKGTAKRYGLKITRSIDERKNIFKSTQAAALYFQDLYNIFGSWELALAAYNAGEYGIIRRIRGANTREYYELSRRKIIPRETRNYVPKVLAVMEIIKNPRKYGFKIPKVNSNLYSKTKIHRVKRATSLNKLAKKLKVSKHMLKKLNQDISGNYIPYLGRKGYELYLPSSKTLALSIIEEEVIVKQKKRNVTKKSPYSIVHITRKNESLYSISKRYNTSISSLKKINNIKRSTIYVGQKIKVNSVKKSSRVLYSYIVKSGDNLHRIAKRFSTRLQHLKSINRLKRSHISIGQKIKVPAHKITHYTVKNGDILSKIAKKNNTTLSNIRNFNSIGRNIYPGQKIILNIKRTN